MLLPPLLWALLLRYCCRCFNTVPAAATDISSDAVTLKSWLNSSLS